MRMINTDSLRTGKFLCCMMCGNINNKGFESRVDVDHSDISLILLTMCKNCGEEKLIRSFLSKEERLVTRSLHTDKKGVWHQERLSSTDEMISATKLAMIDNL